MPSRAFRPARRAPRSPARGSPSAAALPLGLQLLYVVCLPFAGELGPGAATSFVYAYLAGASLVTITAGSLGLVTSVPLSRVGLDGRDARHVIATSWLALTCWSELRRVSSRSPEATWSRRSSAGRTEGTSAPRSAGSSSFCALDARSPSASRSRSRSRSSPHARARSRGSPSPRSPSRSHSPGSAASVRARRPGRGAHDLDALVLCGLLAALDALARRFPGSRSRPPRSPGSHSSRSDCPRSCSTRPGRCAGLAVYVALLAPFDPRASWTAGTTSGLSLSSPETGTRRACASRARPRARHASRRRGVVSTRRLGGAAAGRRTRPSRRPPRRASRTADVRRRACGRRRSGSRAHPRRARSGETEGSRGGRRPRSCTRRRARAGRRGFRWGATYHQSRVGYGKPWAPSRSTRSSGRGSQLGKTSSELPTWKRTRRRRSPVSRSSARIRSVSSARA